MPEQQKLLPWALTQYIVPIDHAGNVLIIPHIYKDARVGGQAVSYGDILQTPAA